MAGFTNNWLTQGNSSSSSNSILDWNPTQDYYQTALNYGVGSSDDYNKALPVTLTNGKVWNPNNLMFSSGDNGNNTSWLSSFGSWLTSPIGSGENSTTPIQLGLQGLGLLSNYIQGNKQLKLAEESLDWTKNTARSNFQTQGTNYLNQALFQLEGLNAFNSDAGAERASNLLAGVDQMNQAGNNLGLNNAFASQQNAIEKYNTLKVS